MKFAWIALLIVSAPALANDSFQLSGSPLDFTAPNVYSRTNVTEAASGTIVYDAGSGAFFGLAPGGNPSSAGSWLQLGSSITGGTLNVSSASTGSERIDRAYISNSGSPTISTQSGTWITNVAHTGTGIVTLTIASGEFTAMPSCQLTAVDSGGCSTDAACFAWMGTNPTTTSLRVDTADYTGLKHDIDFAVTCIGPH